MRPPNPKDAPKLRLRRETLRVLSSDDLTQVAGGFIMRDSVIVRTSRVVAPPEPEVHGLE